MFATLLYFGREIYQMAPPIPETVVSQSSQAVFSREEIQRGQNVWQSMGGMQQGSIWGHGSYLAPDWSADWLHREAVALLDVISREEQGVDFDALALRDAEWMRGELRLEMRENTYDAGSGSLTISDRRAEAVDEVGAHFRRLFMAQGEEALHLREQYALPIQTSLSAENAHALNAFFFWTAWAATTERPGRDYTYTSNWPHEPLVGNAPTAPVFMWSIIPIFLLLAGIGAIVWFYAREFDLWRAHMEPEGGFATSDFFDAVTVTPSMKATAKYFWVVTALFLAQVLLGIITAHYAIEGQGFYGLPFSETIPYAVTRTWHTQLAVLWIATAWLATGLYVAPMLSGHEPKYQSLAVNFLFVSLLIIVVGSFAGEWAP